MILWSILRWKFNCCFLTDKRMAYRTPLSSGENPRHKIKHTNVYKCHQCSTFFARKPRYDTHVKNCEGIYGIVCKFQYQNLDTFQVNLKYQGDLPFVAYCDDVPCAICHHFYFPSWLKVGKSICQNKLWTLSLKTCHCSLKSWTQAKDLLFSFPRLWEEIAQRYIVL